MYPPSVMAVRLVGQNYAPIFRRLQTGRQPQFFGVQGWRLRGDLGAERQNPDLYKQIAAVKCFSMQYSHSLK